MRTFNLLAVSYPEIENPDDEKWYKVGATFLITKDLDNEPEIAQYMRARMVQARNVTIESRKMDSGIESVIPGQKYSVSLDIEAKNGFGSWQFLGLAE